MRKTRNNFKILSATMLTSVVILGMPANADEIGNIKTPNISWDLTTENSSNSIEITNPDGSSQYWQYNYKMPENYNVMSTIIPANALTSENVNNVLFKNINLSDGDKVISNTENKSDLDINIDMLNVNVPVNSQHKQSWGIRNSGELGNITGSFIDNKFVGSSYSYGALFHNTGNIASISGNFINNRVETDDYILSAGILNRVGKIESINGNFYRK